MLLCKLHLTYSLLVATRHNSGWTFWPLFLAEVAQLVWTGWFHYRDPAFTHSPQIFNAVEVRALERPFQKLDGNPVPSTCSPTCFCYHLVFSIFHLVTSCITLLGVFLTCFVYFLLIVFMSVGLCLHAPHSLTLSHHLSFICLSCPHLSLSDFLLDCFHFSSFM